MRVLLLGSDWHGSNSRSCAEGLRRLGHEVLMVDESRVFPDFKLLSSRLALRLVRRRLILEYNRAILSAAKSFPHDILLACKGTYVLADTLRSLRSYGASLYNYYPDTSAFQWGKWLPQSLPEYDCIFYTKPSWYGDVATRIPLKHGYFLPHGYDPTLHRPFDLDARDLADYQCDVSLIATHTFHKEAVLSELIRLRPDLNLAVWGSGWTSHCRTKALHRCIKGFPLLGESYSRAIRASRINLAIMSGTMPGASSGDQTTSRSYTIPASGGFMLHERNEEVLELYREGTEIACFDSPTELAEKIDFYLHHPAERERMTAAGYARCVPLYSYDNRMFELINWHRQNARSAV